MKKIFITFIAVIACSFNFSSSFAQPGCQYIDAGQDIIFDSAGCTTLHAAFHHTGATTSYNVSAIPYAPPYPYNSGTPVLVNQDDKWSGIIALPFNFCFFGKMYSKIVIGANGVLTFNTANANKTNKWLQSLSCPDPNIVNHDTGAYILSCYQDLDPSVSGSAIYQTVIGSYPCRTFVVNFDSVALYPQNPPLCVNLFSTFQVVLYESTNIVEIYVHDKPLCSAWNSGRTVIGIQDSLGTIGYTPPGRNTGQWFATDEAWRFIPNGIPNYTISWYNGGTLIGTGDSVTVCTQTATTYTAELIYNCCAGNQVILTDDVTVLFTGINDDNYSDKNIYIYPNPAKELLSVEYKVQGKNNAGLCKVFNVLGTEIISKSFTGNKFSLDVSNLAKGLYLLKVENENGVAVRRFIKE